MTLVIDADAHAEPSHDWLDEFPSLKERIPRLLPASDPQFRAGTASPEMFAWYIATDLQRGLPVEDRMSAAELLTPFIELIYSPDRPDDLVYPGANQHPTLDADTRVRFLDDAGIGVQQLISGTAYSLYRAIEDPDLSMDALVAVNTWLTDRLGEHTGRLVPVATVRFEDMDRAIAELERMRGRGSRSFLVSGEPVAGVPPFDPSYDRLWSAACDLGMIAVLHVGMGPATMHPGWANTGDPALVKRMATSMSYQAAPIMLNGMVYGGVFERHPDLTLLVCEFGIDWVPFTVRSMEGRGAQASVFLGEYTLPMSPTEYVRRNVRITPLPSEVQAPHELLETMPEVPVFSSDYPHFEGSGSPTEHYGRVLAGVDDDRRAGFLGGNLASCFARMGDPLS